MYRMGIAIEKGYFLNASPPLSVVIVPWTTIGSAGKIPCTPPPSNLSIDYCTRIHAASISLTHWVYLLIIDTGANQRYVTVYNPGRSTPVGSYYATDSNRPLTQYYASSAGGQGAEEGNPNQVNLKVECQPNTDTVLSLRVRSNQM